MKKILLFITLLPYAVKSQELLANGGFEEKNICTEIKKDCAPEAWIATSLWSNYYFDSPKKAFKGNCFVGLTAGRVTHLYVRNFIRSRLLCGLHPGHQYRLVFYVYAVHDILDSIGVYFSQMDFMYNTKLFIHINPQLWSVDGMKDPHQYAQWQKVELLYTADGTEEFLTIGNFKRVDYTGIKKADYRNDVYFFIDEVSLMPVDPEEKLCKQADSVRKAIYNENDRHTRLEHRKQFFMRNPPEPLPLPRTQIPAPAIPVFEPKPETVQPIQHIDTLIIPDIFFATASYELSPKSFPLLDSFAQSLEKFRIDSIVMEGHTDSVGKLAYNQLLSENRAVSVKNYISGKAPAVLAKIITRGFAFRRPVATNKTPEGRQQNRRVEIYVYRRE